MKTLDKMSKKELQDWLVWAKFEAHEYQAFIRDILNELKKR